jgi:hypothetical protein
VIVFIGFFGAGVLAYLTVEIAESYAAYLLIAISNISRCFLLRKMDSAVVENSHSDLQT